MLPVTFQEDIGAPTAGWLCPLAPSSLAVGGKEAAL